MNSSMVLVAGRALLAALFLVAGAHKILTWSVSVAYFAKLGMPAPEAMTAAAIAIELGAGFALLIGWHTRWAAGLLAGFVLVATVAAHRFWEFDLGLQTNQMNHFFKNLAILGGLMLLVAAEKHR